MPNQVAFDCLDGLSVCLELTQICDGFPDCPLTMFDESSDVCGREPVDPTGNHKDTEGDLYMARYGELWG